MKISCSKADLLKGINIVSRAVPNKSSMAILECILIDASGESIRLIANDMELGIETVVYGNIEEPGIVALDAKIFSDIARKLAEDTVYIETGDGMKTLIKCAKSKFNIIGKSGEDFSYLPKLEKNRPVTVSQLTLKDVVRQTIFSTSENDSNRVMSGELFEINENLLRVVSLDGHRISIRNVELSESYDSVSAIVPAKALSEVMKILPGDADSNVDIYINKKYICFEFDSSIIVSRLIDGSFFKVDSVISNNFETKFSIYKKDLLDCIERSSVFLREGDKKPIIMTVKDGQMNLRIQSFIGSMDEDLEIEKTGADIMIGFNPRFFSDALKAIDDDEIDVYMINSKSPCYVKDADENYIYVILPVNFAV